MHNYYDIIILYTRFNTYTFALRENTQRRVYSVPLRTTTALATNLFFILLHAAEYTRLARNIKYTRINTLIRRNSRTRIKFLNTNAFVLDDRTRDLFSIFIEYR